MRDTYVRIIVFIGIIYFVLTTYTGTRSTSMYVYVRVVIGERNAAAFCEAFARSNGRFDASKWYANRVRAYHSYITSANFSQVADRSLVPTRMWRQA